MLVCVLCVVWRSLGVSNLLGSKGMSCATSLRSMGGLATATLVQVTAEEGGKVPLLAVHAGS